MQNDFCCNFSNVFFLFCLYIIVDDGSIVFECSIEYPYFRVGQKRLRNGSVLIIGAGGLGCPAAIYLAGAGIGRLGIVDYDTIVIIVIIIYYPSFEFVFKDMIWNHFDFEFWSKRSIKV